MLVEGLCKVCAGLPEAKEATVKPKPAKLVKEYHKQCKECGHWFTTPTSKKIYCNDDCYTINSNRNTVAKKENAKSRCPVCREYAPVNANGVIYCEPCDRQFAIYRKLIEVTCPKCKSTQETTARQTVRCNACGITWRIFERPKLKGETK